MANQPEILTKPFELGYTYTRSTGPLIGRFLTELREGRITGVRGSDGSVIVPPVEFDPVSCAALDELVPVADTGTVTTWCWVKQPTTHHVLQPPVRLRAGEARRRRCADAARGRRGRGVRDAQRHARQGALGCRAARIDHRHCLLRAGLRRSSDD